MTGDTVNLASRLDDLAAAGETLISDAVRRAASHMAICFSRGQVSVSGFRSGRCTISYTSEYQRAHERRH